MMNMLLRLFAFAAVAVISIAVASPEAEQSESTTFPNFSLDVCSGNNSHISVPIDCFSVLTLKEDISRAWISQLAHNLEGSSDISDMDQRQVFTMDFEDEDKEVLQMFFAGMKSFQSAAFNQMDESDQKQWKDLQDLLNKDGCWDIPNNHEDLPVAKLTRERISLDSKFPNEDRHKILEQMPGAEIELEIHINNSCGLPISDYVPCLIEISRSISENGRKELGEAIFSIDQEIQCEDDKIQAKKLGESNEDRHKILEEMPGAEIELEIHIYNSCGLPISEYVPCLMEISRSISEKGKKELGEALFSLAQEIQYEDDKIQAKELGESNEEIQYEGDEIQAKELGESNEDFHEDL